MQIEVEGRRVWFDTEGAARVPAGREMRERPTMVLLHGGPGSFDHSYVKPDFARLTQVAQVLLSLPGRLSTPYREDGAARGDRGSRPLPLEGSPRSLLAAPHRFRHVAGGHEWTEPSTKGPR